MGKEGEEKRHGRRIGGRRKVWWGDRTCVGVKRKKT